MLRRKIAYVDLSTRQVRTEPAPCTDACPLEALTQEKDTGVVRVNPELCNNCGACVAACPYGAIRWSDVLGELLVCDRCGGQPSCVPFCHRGALNIASAPAGSLQTGH